MFFNSFFVGSNITFFWTNTTDSFGHNVNYAGYEGQSAEVLVNNEPKTYTAKEFFDYCLTHSGPLYNSSTPTIPLDQELPSGDTFLSNPENPNKVFTEKVYTLNERGWHYFYCGRPFHCLEGGVKAKVYVSDQPLKDCPFHGNC